MNDTGRPRRAALPDEAAINALGAPAPAPGPGPRAPHGSRQGSSGSHARPQASRQGRPSDGGRQGAGHGTTPPGLYRETAASPGPRGRRRQLRKSILLTLASAIVPGSGLLGAPHRGLKVLGGFTAALSLIVVGVLAFVALTDLPRLARFAANTRVLTAATFLLAVVAVVWVTLITVTHIATRPRRLRGGRRALGAVVVTALAFGVAAPTAVAARYSRDTSLALSTVLQSSNDVKANNRPTLAPGAADPWADQARVNILLLGGDGSASRADAVAKYSIRTDTIMVASIDTATGDTTLIQIPRNVQHTPFPEGSEMAKAFPDGFRGDGDPGEWYINTIWQHVELDYPELMQGSTYRGADALKQGVEGVTGLEINQFILLNIDGLQALIDAMGGVSVNINQPLAIGGDTAKGIKPKSYLQPGPDQHLLGYDAMWYARSRWNTDDYNRMARQSCLINAIVDQANPQTLLTNFEPIAKASSEMLATDITDDQLSAYIDLAFRVKDSGTIKRLVFSNGKNGYSYADPNFKKMRSAVATAIAPSTTATASAKPTPKPSSTTTPSKSPSATPNQQEGVQTVADVCAYQPVGG